MSYLARQICPHCGKPSLTGQIHHDCQKGCFLDGLVSAFPYRPLFKEVIRQIKFEPFIFSALEELIINALGYFDREKQFLLFRRFVKQEHPVVIPIPLYKSKLRQRGFNQAQIIAQTVAGHYSLPLEEKLLFRVRPTRPQFQLEAKERRQNIKGAFSIDQERLGNCRQVLPPILLVDDIWTSGATIREACRVLKRAGIVKVWGLTLSQ